MRMLAGLVAAVLLAAPVARAAPEPIRLGIITSLSGNFATFGAMEVAGYKVAAEEVNAKGGVLGRKLELVIEDDASNQNAALAAAEKLVSQDVTLIIGAFASSITKPLAGYLTRKKITLLNSNSADTSITKPGSPYVFRVGPTTDQYGDASFELLARYKDAKTIAILVSNDALGKSAAASIRERAAKSGHTIVGDQVYDRGLTDFRPTLNNFKAANPDIVALSSYEEDAATLLRQAKEVNLSPKVFIGVGATGYALPQFISGAGDAAEYVFSAAPWRPEAKFPGAQLLHDKLVKVLNAEPSHHAAKSYGGLLAAAEAIGKAGSTDREAIRKALHEVKILTAYGPISFDAGNGFQNQNPAPSLIIQVQTGKFVVVSPDSVASGKPIYPTPAWEKR